MSTQVGTYLLIRLPKSLVFVLKVLQLAIHRAFESVILRTQLNVFSIQLSSL